MRSTIAFVALLTLAACGDDEPTNVEENRLVGRYLLISVDDKSVPIVQQESGPRIVLRTSALDFVSSEDVDISFTFEIDGIANSFEDRSPYRRSGSQLTIYFIAGTDTTVLPGVVSGNDITIMDRDPAIPSAPIVRWLYRKG
jgi:hypothetical protein